MRNLETAATFAATLVAQALVIATIFVAGTYPGNPACRAMRDGRTSEVR